MVKSHCIAGMHRSGTSLTASWLKKCGVALDIGSVIGQSDWNIRGHFEDKNFVQFHEDIIKSKRKNSYGWKIYPKDSLFFSPSKLQQAQKLIKLRNDNYTLWGWKDPRTSLFLEQWKQIIPNLKSLLIWRPAREVIDSLLYRSKHSQQELMKINLTGAIRLWSCYNQRIYEYKQKYPKDSLLLPLSYIVNNDYKVFQLIQTRLDIPVNYISLEKLYEPKLINQKKGLNNLDSFIADCINM